MESPCILPECGHDKSDIVVKPLDPLFPNHTREEYIRDIRNWVEGTNELVDKIIGDGHLYGKKIHSKKVGRKYKINLNKLKDKDMKSLIQIHTKLWNDI